MSARRPVNVFTIIALATGLFYVFTVPPYQGADEPNHLFRAYAISQGELEPTTENARRGGAVPVSLLQMFDAFAPLRWWAPNKTSRDSVGHFASIPLYPTRTDFVDYPNTAVYPAPVYLPAAVGLAAARASGSSALTTIRLARLGGLIFWVACGILALSLLPKFHWVITALLLLPMSLFAHATVTADSFTDGIAIVCVAYILRLAYGTTEVAGRQLILLCLLTVLLASAKLVYTPLLLLAFLIPREKFAGPGKFSAAALLGGLAVATLLFWSWRSGEIYLAYADYAPAFREGLDLREFADVAAHRDMIVAAPYRLFRAVANSLVQAAPMYVPAYIGTFGWLDTYLPIWTIVAAYLWLIALAVASPVPDGFRWPQRLLLLLIVALCYHAVILSQLLSWEPVGSPTVGTVQGRYLTPFAPLLFLAVSGWYRAAWPRVVCWALVGTGALLLNGFAGWVVYLRYYGA